MGNKQSGGPRHTALFQPFQPENDLATDIQLTEQLLLILMNVRPFQWFHPLLTAEHLNVTLWNYVPFCRAV